MKGFIIPCLHYTIQKDFGSASIFSGAIFLLESLYVKLCEEIFLKETRAVKYVYVLLSLWKKGKAAELDEV